MKEGLYEIVAMRRSTHGKWVFTARPLDSEISFECGSDVLEDELFKHSRETLWLYIKDNPGGDVLDYFETEEEKLASEELARMESEEKLASEELARMESEEKLASEELARRDSADDANR